MMAYLTYEEMKELSGLDIDENTFEKLLPKASAVLDHITNHFYVWNNINEDNEWRVKQFKQALCAQIEFFNELGSTTYESIKRIPQTFSAGRTSVTHQTGKAEGRSLVAEDVYIFLEGTGLLFAGVGVKM